METDVRFYQAAATVIPTLLLAYAIHSRDWSIRYLEESVHPHKLRRSRGLMVFDAYLFTASIIAEALCLATLALDEPREWSYLSILAIILLLAWNLCYEILKPLLVFHDNLRLANIIYFTPVVVIPVAFSVFTFLLKIGV